MFAITTIGSCRIATPARMFRGDYGYAVNKERNYGFCHTSMEAVQQLRFMQGDFEPPQDIWRLIARGADYDVMMSQTHAPSDLYVVELSSAKRLMHGDTCVQLNYVGNEYRDFFAEKSRVSGFWAVCRTEDQDQIDAWLAEHWSADLDKMTDSQVLRHLRMTMTTEEDLRKDIRTIMDRVPNVLFITHVNAVKLDGLPIESRSTFIDMVTRAVRAEGGIVYNPTPRMQEVGQTIAIEDHSDSLAHFTEDFCGVMFPDWYDMAFAPAIMGTVRQGGAEAVDAVLAPHVKAMIASGRADGKLVDRLDALAQDMDGLPNLVMLQSDLDVAFRSADQAIARLEALFEQDTTDVAVGTELLTMALSAERLGLAQSTLNKLDPTKVRLDPTVLFDAARSLTNKNRGADALPFLEVARATLGRRITASQADLYVDAVLQAGSSALTDMPERDLALLTDLLSPQKRLAVRAAADPETFLDTCADDIRALGGDDVLPLLLELNQRGHFMMSLDALAIWRTAQDTDRLIHIGLRRFVDQQYEAVINDASDLPDQLNRLAHILKAHPLHSDTRLTLRDLRKGLLSDIRMLYADKDAAGLQTLETANANLPDPLLELPLMQARLAFEAEDYPRASILAEQATQIDGEHYMSWVLLMRAALKAGDVILTGRAAHKVRDLADEDTERFCDEAQARLDRLPIMALRAARVEEDPFEAHALYGLAAGHADNVELAQRHQARIEAQVARSIRDQEVEAEPEVFLAFAEKAVEVFPNNDRIRLSLARHYMRKRAFEAALPHWQKAVDLVPGNESYQAQLERCEARVNPTERAS